MRRRIDLISKNTIPAWITVDDKLAWKIYKHVINDAYSSIISQTKLKDSCGTDLRWQEMYINTAVFVPVFVEAMISLKLSYRICHVAASCMILFHTSRAAAVHPESAVHDLISPKEVLKLNHSGERGTHHIRASQSSMSTMLLLSSFTNHDRNMCTDVLQTTGTERPLPRTIYRHLLIAELV
jgi:hypothetical protein